MIEAFSVMHALNVLAVVMVGIACALAGYLLFCKSRRRKPVATKLPPPEPPLFITYEMADGSTTDDYQFVTDLEWFDERDREVRLMKRTYRLVSEELVILPDPYPIEEEDDE